MSTNTLTETVDRHESISIGQLAEYIGLTPRFIEGLVRGERLPGAEIDGQLQFRRDDVVDWLEQKIRTLDKARVSELESTLEHSLLADGTFRTHRSDRLTSRLPLKGIALDAPATDKQGVLQALTTLAQATGLLFDNDRLLESLLDREALCSTAVPGGLALCHPRRPLPGIIERQFLCFLRTEKPVDFGAENGEGTSLFFLLCTPDDRSHLHGLARLARILHPGTLDQLRTASSTEQIHATLANAEALIHPPSA